MECKQSTNLSSCPCTYAGCPRKGLCCECLKYHLGRDELPASCFSKDAEASYDRTIANFIKDRQG